MMTAILLVMLLIYIGIPTILIAVAFGSFNRNGANATASFLIKLASAISLLGITMLLFAILTETINLV